MRLLAGDHRADPAGGQRRLLHRAPADPPRGAAARAARLGPARRRAHPQARHQAGRPPRPPPPLTQHPVTLVMCNNTVNQDRQIIDTK